MKLLIMLILACVPAKIAYDKGRNFWLWYLYGFFFWLIALIHAVFLLDELSIPRTISKNYVRKCPHCLTEIGRRDKNCPTCGKNVVIKPSFSKV